MVIGMREDPPLPLPRLGGRDQVTAIRARTLRFTLEEASAFLKRTVGLDLSTAAVTALTNRTEGWIAALQLVGVAIRAAIEAGAGDATEAFAADFGLVK